MYITRKRQLAIHAHIITYTDQGNKAVFKHIVVTFSV